jgi:hypothetical protein
MGEMADDFYDQYLLDSLDDDLYDMSDSSGTYHRSPRHFDTGLRVEGRQATNAQGPAETEKAILWIRLNGEEVWLPRSQLLAQERTYIVINSWLAGQRGWTEYNVNLKPGETHEPDYDRGYDLNDDIPF